MLVLFHKTDLARVARARAAPPPCRLPSIVCQQLCACSPFRTICTAAGLIVSVFASVRCTHSSSHQRSQRQTPPGASPASTPNFFLSFFFFLFFSLLRILGVDSSASRLSPLAPRLFSSPPFFAVFLLIGVMGGCRPPHPPSNSRFARVRVCRFCCSPGGFSSFFLCCVSLCWRYGGLPPPTPPAQFSFRRSLVARALEFVSLTTRTRLFSSLPFFAVFLFNGVMGGSAPHTPRPIVVSLAGRSRCARWHWPNLSDCARAAHSSLIVCSSCFT